MTCEGPFRFSFALGIFAAALLPLAASAQSGPGKTPPPKPAENGKAVANAQKQVDELAEAAKALPGSAGKPECVWLGRRVVILLWRNDIDTALRHLAVYDRFNCPSVHIRAAFRCLIQQGPIDPKALETLNSRAFACWVHPDQVPPQPAATSAPAASSGATPR
jgi:hypothetical protein